MTSFRVIFQPEAIEQLEALEDYIAAEASPAIAAQYSDAIIESCNALRDFPHRGTLREDIRPGLRTISHRGRTIIVFSVGNERVDIIGIFYGGQNWEATLTV